MKQLEKSDEAMEPVMDELLEKISQGVPLIVATPSERKMLSTSDRKSKKRYWFLLICELLKSEY